MSIAAWANLCQIEDGNLVAFEFGAIWLLGRIDIAHPRDVAPDNF